MALYAHGVNYANSIDPSPMNIASHGVLGGKLRSFQDYATVTGGASMLSQDYVIVGGKLPIGSQVVKIVVCTDAEALSTDSTIQIGDEGDPNRYVTATTVTGGDVYCGPNTLGGMLYTVTGETDNYIRIAGGADSCTLSECTIKVSIMYVVE